MSSRARDLLCDSSTGSGPCLDRTVRRWDVMVNRGKFFLLLMAGARSCTLK